MSRTLVKHSDPTQSVAIHPGVIPYSIFHPVHDQIVSMNGQPHEEEKGRKDNQSLTISDS